MGRRTPRTAALFTLIAVVLCLLPTLGYWRFVASAPHVTAEQARAMLLRDDVRVAFLEPLDEAHAAIFRDRTVALEKPNPEKATLLVCRSGIRSAIRARQWVTRGVPRVLSLEGGVQEWVASGGGLGFTQVGKLGAPPSQAWPRFRESPLWEQGLVVLSFFGVKSLYTLLGAGVLFAVWRREQAELRALRRAMAAFLVGEACCFLNVMLYAERSFPLEHAHGLLMAVSLGFATYAAVLWTRDRVGDGHADRTCAALPLCGACTSQPPRVCRLRRIAQLVVPILAVVAMLPSTANLQGAAYTTAVFGFLRGYWHPVVHQLFELRYLPVVAAGLLAWCEVLLLLPRPAGSELPGMLFSAAAGAMGFSFMRLLFVAPFANNLVWFVFWEESTELLYVGAVIGLLWIFRSNWFALELPAGPGLSGKTAPTQKAEHVDS